MLTLVKPTSAQTPTPSIDVVYDRTKPALQRFSFSDSRVLIDHDTTISLTLTGATFASTPILWSLAPLLGGIPPVVVQEGPTIHFKVPPPASYFTPWSFKLNVDDDGGEVRGIASPDVFLVLPPIQDPAPRLNTSLAYDPGDGSFRLDNGLLLGRETVLINTFYPLVVSITLPSSGPGAAALFSKPYFFWASGQAPTGVTVDDDGDTTKTVTLRIGTTAVGFTQGFKFLVNVGNGNTVLSPDPILINATLGDG
jgi:hypothetical protein